jgi:peptidoglycan/LPS O-acetylase OafA/YrhL
VAVHELSEVSKPLTRTLPPAKKIAAIEAARGLCATYVVVFHILQIFGYKYSWQGPASYIVDMFSYGHEAVLAFFVLSGFSIHYVNLDRDLSIWSGIRRYYYLRVRRLVPIFWLTCAGVFLFYGIGVAGGIQFYRDAVHTVSPRDIGLTLAFLADRETACGRLATVFPSNPPLWSLAYEAVYYALYPAFWWLARRFSLRYAVVLGFIISAIAAIVPDRYCSHWTNVIALYYPWCLGAAIAELKRRDQTIRCDRWLRYVIGYVALLSALTVAASSVLWLSPPLWILAITMVIASPVMRSGHTLSARAEYWVCAGLIVGAAVSFLLLSMFVEVAHKMTAYRTHIVVIGVSAVVLFRGWANPLARARFGRWLAALVPLGGISYALYLVHFPLLIAGREWSGHLWGVADYGLIAIPAIFLTARLLELRLQPRAASLMDRGFKN